MTFTIILNSGSPIILITTCCVVTIPNFYDRLVVIPDSGQGSPKRKTA